MITDPKIVQKLEQIWRRYMALRYRTVAEVSCEVAETREHFRNEPDGELKWKKAKRSVKWGGSWITAWFRGDATVPTECAGERVLLQSASHGAENGLQGVETRVLVDGVSRGLFSRNHSAVMLTAKAKAGAKHHIAVEAYSGHDRPPCNPGGQYIQVPRKAHTFEGLYLVLEREVVSGFVYDLRVLLDLVDRLDANSLRRAKIVRALSRVFAAVDAIPAEREEEHWTEGLAEARRIMRPLMETPNGPTTPFYGIIGNSHIDTAWLWPLAESWRKCSRTFSSVLSLMERYPEFLFVQPAACHAEMTERLYPEIFERVREKVREGRWEPNGGTWVEPDGNIPSGEAFVRQFLVGQGATRRMFGYTSDTMWMPDTFGYSAALPQIMRGCGIEFFCTQKISWNDTTVFPHDSFHWRGIDGSEVLAHFNTTYVIPPTVPQLIDHWNRVPDKDVQDRRLGAFGYGDGGGGPTVEMLESARRLRDIEGCPRAEYMTVSEFMTRLRDDIGYDLPTWDGEIYLELHRGTLTSIAKIKRGNRKLEFALRDAEMMGAIAALRGAEYPVDTLLEIWKDLLTHQFHDILPGSSIPIVNDQAFEMYERRIAEAREIAADGLKHVVGAPRGQAKALALFNALSWRRDGEIAIDDAPEGARPEGVTHQWVAAPDGAKRLIVAGAELPALGSAILPLGSAAEAGTESPFVVSGDRVETPHARVRFDKAGRIVSLIDKVSGREVVKPGGVVNCLLSGEDVPHNYDNWDIDRSQRLKRRAEDRLVASEVVAEGPLQLRIRRRYEIGFGSALVQDVVFHAESPQIDFETVVDWNEKHMLLQAGFDFDVLASSARSEIQFGHVERPTHENQADDWARFETCAHKWTDVSDNGFGVAILNDCKYGVGAVGGRLTLSLLKSGRAPDDRGEKGRHVFTYSVLPHAGAWSVESVVRPAYELNTRVLASSAPAQAEALASLVEVDAPNVIVESVKWAEEGDAVVLRLYEAGKTVADATVSFGFDAKSVAETNMLEENASEPRLTKVGSVRLRFRPFEIKTLRCEV